MLLKKIGCFFQIFQPILTHKQFVTESLFKYLHQKIENVFVIGVSYCFTSALYIAATLAT